MNKRIFGLLDSSLVDSIFSDLLRQPTGEFVWATGDDDQPALVEVYVGGFNNFGEINGVNFVILFSVEDLIDSLPSIIGSAFIPIAGAVGTGTDNCDWSGIDDEIDTETLDAVNDWLSNNVFDVIEPDETYRQALEYVMALFQPEASLGDYLH